MWGAKISIKITYIGSHLLSSQKCPVNPVWHAQCCWPLVVDSQTPRPLQGVDDEVVWRWPAVLGDLIADELLLDGDCGG